jgi:hypothetical protein
MLRPSRLPAPVMTAVLTESDKISNGFKLLNFDFRLNLFPCARLAIFIDGYPGDG